MKTLNRTLMIKSLLLIPCTLIIQSYAGSGRLSSQKLKEESWKFPKKILCFWKPWGVQKSLFPVPIPVRLEIKLRYIAKPDETVRSKRKARSYLFERKYPDYDSQRPTQTYFEEWTWIISVPDGTYIKCIGGSSDFEVNDFNGFFKANYGSGSFVFDNVDGNIEMSLAQLYAQIHDSKGSFRLSSAGGAIRATGLTITGNSSFSTGMGIIKISLARPPESDLYVGSSFNRAQVRFNGHPVSGYFEFIAMADRGRIISPFKFDKEEIFMDDIKNYRNSSDFGKKSEYKRNSFIRGNSKPKITLKTVTGIAQLIK